MQYFIVFLEGIITFISPCLLPMLPVYISYFAAGEGKGSKTAVKNALLFVFGFTCVFVALGVFASALGGFLIKYQAAVNIATGLLVLLFGLSYLGIIPMPSFSKNGNSAVTGGSAFLFGIAFSLGWTPCIGAFLGSALLLASHQGSVLQGVIMLLLYSAGLGIPFVASAVLIDKFKAAFNFIKRNYKKINIVCGILLCLMGILMMTGIMQRVLNFLAR